MSNENELLQKVEDRALQMMKADQGLHGMSRTEIFLLWGVLETKRASAAIIDGLQTVCLLTKTRIELESHPLRSTDSEQLPEVGPLETGDISPSSGPLDADDKPTGTGTGPQRRGPGRPKKEG